MSMKRSNKKSGGARSPQAEGSLGFNPPPTDLPNWEEAVSGQPDDAFTPYALARTFARSALVLHPKFGKGLVLGVEGAKIEVLFQDGVRKLAHAGG